MGSGVGGGEGDGGRESDRKVLNATVGPAC